MGGMSVGFVGAGNMAQAILGGMLEAGFPTSDVKLSASTEATCIKVREHYCVSCTTNCADVIKASDVLVLAVKPQILPEILANYRSLIAERTQILVSVAAGVSLGSLRRALSESKVSIVRAMPNMPALVGRGITGLLCDAHCSQDHKRVVESLFKSVGVTVWVESDADMDVVTAVSGSGPAYQFYLWESLIEVAVELGLESDTAEQLVFQTVRGALALAEQSADALTVLRQNVTSKKGTTEAAVLALQRAGVKKGLATAVRSARSRAEELSKEVGRLLNDC